MASRFSKGTFLRSVATLMGGAAAAQAINLAITPLLSRMYSPADFGVLGLLSSFSVLFVGVAAARYDMAIVLPKAREDAAALMAAAATIVALMAICCLAVVALAGEQIARAFEAPGLGSWLYFAPLLVLSAGLYNVLTYWCMRHKEFSAMSAASVVAAGSSAGAKIAGGSAGFGAWGLVGGQVFGQVVAFIALAWRAFRSSDLNPRGIARWSAMTHMLREHREFPLYQAPMTLLNTFAQNLPVYILGAYYGAGVVGQWALTLLLLATPVQIVANSVRQVLYQRLSEESARGGDVKRLLVRATVALALGGTLLAIPAGLLAPTMFEIVLGDEWSRAGEFAKWTMPWQVSVLAATPAVALFPVIRMQRTVLIWQALSGTCVGLTLLWGATYGIDRAVLAYSATMVLVNAALIALVIRRANVRPS